MFKKNWLSNVRKEFYILFLVIALSIVLFPFVPDVVKGYLVNWYPATSVIIMLYPVQVLRALKGNSYIDQLPMTKKKLFLKEMIIYIFGLLIYYSVICYFTFKFKQQLLSTDIVLTFSEVVNDTMVFTLGVGIACLFMMSSELLEGTVFATKMEAICTALLGVAIAMVIFFILSCWMAELLALLIVFMMSLIIFLWSFCKVDLISK